MNFGLVPRLIAFKATKFCVIPKTNRNIQRKKIIYVQLWAMAQMEYRKAGDNNRPT